MAIGVGRPPQITGKDYDNWLSAEIYSDMDNLKNGTISSMTSEMHVRFDYWMSYLDINGIEKDYASFKKRFENMVNLAAAVNGYVKDMKANLPYLDDKTIDSSKSKDFYQRGIAAIEKSLQEIQDMLRSKDGPLRWFAEFEFISRQKSIELQEPLVTQLYPYTK